MKKLWGAPREISRAVWLFINHGGSLTGDILDSKYYPLSIANCIYGLELLVKSTFKIDVKKFALLQRLQEIVLKNYKDRSLSTKFFPVNSI